MAAHKMHSLRYRDKNINKIRARSARYREDDREKYNTYSRASRAKREASALALELMTITPSSLADVVARLEG